MVIDNSTYTTQLTILEQNSTDNTSFLTVGQIVRIRISVIGTDLNQKPNLVRLNNCFVSDEKREVKIIDNGEPLSLFSSAVWILGSEENTVSFHFRVFTIGNAKTGDLLCQEN